MVGGRGQDDLISLPGLAAATGWLGPLHMVLLVLEEAGLVSSHASWVPRTDAVDALGPELRSCPVSLLPQSRGWSRSWGPSTFQVWGDELHLLMGETTNNLQ